MGRFDFVSPGAAAGDALRKMMVEREAQQRQDMLDKIALDREARLKEHDAANLANTQANTASLIAQRTATEADRTRTNQEQAADKVVKSHRMDEDVNDSEYATATKVPGLEGYFKPTVTQGAQTGEDANGVPQYDVKQGHKFAGSPEERKVAETKQKVEQAFQANPDLRKQPAVAALMDIAAANGNYEPVMNVLAKMAEPTPRYLYHDRDTNQLMLYNMGTGKPEPLPPGFVPSKDDKLVNETAPPTVMSAGMFDPQAIAVYQRLLESGAQPANITRSNAPLMNTVLGNIGREGDQAVSDLTGARSSYAADSDALKQTTKALSAITAFEGTAKKNILVMQGLIGKITDTGFPILNAPIRSLEGKLGDPNVAAFYASIKTVVPEIARIITQPNLTGQLTDSAREDIAGILSGEANVGQMMAVLDVLRKDMDNRTSELQKQKASLESQIKTRGTDHPGHETNANAKPVKKDGESVADFAKRISEWMNTRQAGATK